MAQEAAASCQRAEQLKKDLDTEVQQLEAKGGGAGVTVAVQQRVGVLSSQLSAALESARQQVDSIPDTKARATWQRKMDRLEANSSIVQGAVEKQLGQFYRVQREQENRNRLLGGNERKANQGGVDDAMRNELKANSGLKQSSEMLDGILDQGRATLSNIVNQNNTLKNTRKKLLDAANVMGVSASLVNVIDRRNKEDKWMVYGGMVLVLFILFSLWYLLRW